ncbi:hypothetical protein BD309DRAFT_892274 [Dichomitus squalens]|uniref:Uncharacterized protein n=1 Tax=Dichomitus squalens TaxID=114155 RepID=A0A4V2JZC1_9APHY|nr:uncharacterized protein DICSQDRAFT_166602 [Dichomitus squalens LYAD-421 SS1]EJF65599.1 hypothetical protein DICSQDRAFT_166602 [Dichomitus squalens LYAD-421 SS1]TBU24363.1 hypothetical protein BD311DRAFT_791039 [Dichomitus squalens]TBU44524.1 hypothetical protein BD309DRAFT_892274 [Dichomitus squalens]TBU54326.1 hypothetical protein BD310DRAFT_936106 [Dichomitus squalens]
MLDEQKQTQDQTIDQEKSTLGDQSPNAETATVALQLSHTAEQKGFAGKTFRPDFIARITWPVPHIMVFIGDVEYACGRQAIAEMGHRGLLEWIHKSFLWKPKRVYDTYNPAIHFNQSQFSKEASLLGTFYHIHGEDDLGPVPLSEVGWAQMMTNIVKIELYYEKTGDDKY